MKCVSSFNFGSKLNNGKTAPLVTFILFMFSAIGRNVSFNIDTKFPVIISDPAKSNGERGESYFGYELQFLSGQGDRNSQDWLLVGAPKANSSYPSHDSLIEPGALYSCPLNSASIFSGDCSQIVIQRQSSETSRDVQSPFREVRNNGWLGGSLYVNNSSPNSRIAVCAHRWTNRLSESEYVNGACYWSQHSVNNKEDFFPLRPLIRSRHQLTPDKRLNYGRGQAGFSVHIAQRDGTEEMIIGAPGVYDWTGSVIRVSDYNFNGDSPINTRRRKREIIDFGSTVVANVSLMNQLQPYDYFGYSVFSGRFFTERRVYVAGAPRAADMRGKVLVFDFDDENSHKIKVLLELNGTQLGEYYGASILAASLNMDNLDELFVGAPQHTFTSDVSGSGDQGKVYVYVNKGGSLKEAPPLYGNKVNGARFGSAIAQLGDVNLDKFNDIAVGAPYENDRGAVYIYLGGKDGVDYHPTTGYWQRISPNDFPSLPVGLRGFGISISAGDVDRNHYPDLAIGSYLSGHAVILRSKAVVQLGFSMSSSSQNNSWKIAPNSKVNVKTCLSYTSEKLGIGKLDVSYELFFDAEYVNNPRLSLEVNGEVYTQQPYNFTETFSGPNVPKCRVFAVSVLNSAYQDFSKPALLRISGNLLDSTTKVFCARCPVRDEKVDKFYEQKMSFTSECGADEICQEDLEVEASFPHDPHFFVIGSKKVVEFQVSVTNLGEPSYVTRVDLFLPANTTLELQGNGQCKSGLIGELIYSCKLQNNPLKTSRKEIMKLFLDVSALPSGLTNLSIVIEARVGSGAARGRQTMFDLTLPLRTEIDLEVLGSPPVEQRSYQVLSGTRNATRDRMPLEHGFEIRNALASPTEEIDVDILLPASVVNAQGELVSLVEPDIIVKTSQKGRPNQVPCTVSDILEPGDRKLKATVESIKKSLARPSESISSVAHRAAVIDCINTKNARCRIISCSARSLTKGGEIGIFVAGTMLLQDILDYIGNQDDFVLSSAARVTLKKPAHQHLNLKPDSAMASTHVLPQGPPAQQAVASWIIVLSVLAGAALLSLCAYGLYKVGFFKRQRIPQDALICYADNDAAGEIDRDPQPAT